MTPGRTEHIILSELLNISEYGQRFLPHLKPELFRDESEKLIFTCAADHIQRYGVPPTYEQVVMAMDKQWKGSEDDLQECNELVNSLTHNSLEPRPMPWLKDLTQDFIRRKGFGLEMVNAINAAEEKKSPIPAMEGAIKAFDYSLDETPGLSLDWERLYDFLQSPDERFPFGLDILDEMTCGGPSRKTVTVIVAPTNTGKSLVLCHQAAEYLRQGRNVVYITLEMADQKILKRIYANLLNADINALDGWPREKWTAEAEALGDLGKLRIREYASRSAHAGNFRQFLGELKRRENFVPDIIIVDYLNECLSRTMRYGRNVGMYQYVGAIASELRALATEYNAVVWTATQTNRDGYTGDPDLKNTSESAQVNAGADLIIGVTRDEHLPDKLRFRVLKNRDREHKDRLFMVGVDTAKMRLYDLDGPFEVAGKVEEKRKAISGQRTKLPSFLKA